MSVSVAKNETRDRLNSQGHPVTRVLLPFCPRLRRFVFHIIDTRMCFYLYQVDNSRWHTPLGLHHIDDETCDDVNNDDLESWWDLRQSPENEKTHDGYGQIAIVGVMMGDTDSVSVLEMTAGSSTPENSELTHRCYLNAHCCRATSSVTCMLMIWSSAVSASSLRATCMNSCPCPAQSKRDATVHAEFWSGALDGVAGTLGFPMCRRTSLLFVTLTGVVLGVARTPLQHLLGAWNFALSFRREASCCLGVAFLGTLPVRRPVPTNGAVLEGLFLVCGIAPLLQADLGPELVGIQGPIFVKAFHLWTPTASIRVCQCACRSTCCGCRLGDAPSRGFRSAASC